LANQLGFADLSGDYNPMHLDPIVARRTQAGAPVVHGVHSMLWALDQLSSLVEMHGLNSLDADFTQFLYVDEDVSLYLLKTTNTETRAELRIGDSVVSHLMLGFGGRSAGTAAMADVSTGLCYSRSTTRPLPMDWSEVVGAHGVVHYFATTMTPMSDFPHLCAAIGLQRMKALLSLTRLIGMACPGLHSIFHRIRVRLVEDHNEIGELRFATAKSDSRFSIANISVRADGIVGTLKCSLRRPPTLQPTCAELRPIVSRDEFQGNTAFVIGGSRGLGELSAKLLALGGARVIISYFQGREEAEKVVEEISKAGGSAICIALDVLQPLKPQLEKFTTRPTSIYFFATSRISGRVSPVFSAEQFNLFNRLYINAFYQVCSAFATGDKKPVHVFYPSTIFVADPPKGMLEYSMSKAAGEVIASNLSLFMPGIKVEIVRLPRLPTDQTASVLGSDMGSATDVMLPILRRVEGLPTKV
jgi:hypothetical protein